MQQGLCQKERPLDNSLCSDRIFVHSYDEEVKTHMGHLMGLDTHCLYTSIFKPVVHTSLQEALIGRTVTTNGGIW